MYPGTILNYIDNSQINTETEILLDTRSPLWLMASTFPKGPEKLTVTDATNFYELYGDTMDFDKYGQLNLQAKNIIDNGGRLWVKRLMPKDATYGNLYYTATVTDETQVTTHKAKITWKAVSKENIKSYEDLKTAINTDTQVPEGQVANTFVPFAFIDNGRGGSIVKNIRFTPDYNISRNLNTTFYNFEIYEGGTRKEYNTVTVDPDVIINDKAYRLYKEDYLQIDAFAYEEQFDKLVDAIYNIVNPKDEQGNVTENHSKREIRSMDLLFGYTNRGETSDFIEVDYDQGSAATETSPAVPPTASFNVKYGTSLGGGIDGWYREKEDETIEPIELQYVHEEEQELDIGGKSNYFYEKALVDLMVQFYHGEIDDIIYDVDNYRLFGIADANLPKDVKQAITEYTVFRNDCFFFRDLCIVGDDSFESILSRSNTLVDKDTTASGNNNEFAQTFMYADYCTTYDIVDPETRKREKVTMMYDLVSCLTRAYITTPFNPNAGTYNGYILESALPDSLNFIPLKKPRVNYKQSMDDARINYAIYEENNNLVVQSLYTKNKIYSQLSYINNVLAMQEIGRRVAMVCPSVRYSLQVNGNDISDYTKIINAVLERYAGSFDVLEFVYSGDSIHVQQKIFYGSIQFSFANWYQTEIFDLIANPMTIVANTDEEE